MATPKSHRIGIWIIAIVMTVGTIGSFAVMVLADQNTAIDTQEQQKAYEEYMAQMKKAQEERLKTLRPLDGYKAAPFTASDVTELKTEVLKQGDGTALAADSGMTINYFGWKADGTIFDSTNINGTTTPTDQLKLDQVIEGWKKGLVGQKAGSTVKLTIPAAQAYGEVDNGMGQPTGPLVFIVEIIAVK